MLHKITFYCHPSSKFLFSEWFWKYFTSKSSSSDVFAIKSRLERRPTTSLASAYTHGPKQIPRNLFWCSYYIKNFLSTHERSALLSKFWFLSNFCQNFGLKTQKKLIFHEFLKFKAIHLKNSLGRSFGFMITKCFLI